MQFEQAGAYIINILNTQLPAHLTYHNVPHVLDVHDAALRIGEQEGVSPVDMVLLRTAALFHDAGYIKYTTGHEEESCRMVKAALPGFDYTPEQIELICGMIMATQLPQQPQTLLEQILADADLDYLGRDDYFTISHQLYLELSWYGVIDDEQEWNKKQIDFLEKHRYFTKTAINLRQAKKQANIEQIKAQKN